MATNPNLNVVLHTKTRGFDIIDALVPAWKVEAERKIQIQRDDTPIYHALCLTHRIYPHDN